MNSWSAIERATNVVQRGRIPLVSREFISIVSFMKFFFLSEFDSLFLAFVPRYKRKIFIFQTVLYRDNISHLILKFYVTLLFIASVCACK